ncbi:MAG: restriction endonuclease subunit S, partial [Romboutsia timonensis]|uniref:restriction endonuclease subunit S n=1 Tax=Romboutsia timonensis TaxID=1776391 RepID=UPI002A7545BC
ELFELIDKLDSSKQELLENISNTRNKVLRLAIQGKLVEQGEDDEPASLLLERIKAEKEQLIKDKVIKKEKPLPDISEEEKSFDLPKGWEWCRLGQLYNIVRGSSPRPKGHPKYFTESKTEYNWVTIKDITLFLDGKYLYNTNEYLTYEGSLKSRFIKSGEIIIAVSGSIGKTAIMGTDGYIYDGLAGLKNIVDNEILRDYIYIALNAWKEHLNNISEGTSIQNINTEKLNLLNIALPPLEEQKRIVEKFDLIMDYLDKLQQEIESQEVILEDILK